MNKWIIVGLIAVIAIAGAGFYLAQAEAPKADANELNALSDSLGALEENPEIDNYTEFIPQDSF
ncbi:MAG: hypothetical protein QXO69_03545 [archaeon]